MRAILAATLLMMSGAAWAQDEAGEPVFGIVCSFDRVSGGAPGTDGEMTALEENRGGLIVQSDRRPSQMLLRSDLMLEIPSSNGVRRFVIALPQGDLVSQLVTVQPDGTAMRSLHVAPLGADAFVLSEVGRCEIRE
ncbi:MAG: hypothetical protein AAFP28_12190 [Pseudomonadota bacterium]